jgi:hypothetical protein
MEISQIVARIDEEIQKLNQARALLAGRDGHISTVRGLRKKHVSGSGTRSVKGGPRSGRRLRNRNGGL